MNLNLPVSARTLFLYYGAVILSVIFVYATGRLIKFCLLGGKRENVSALSILTCSILGLTALVTVYSIVVTKGITANWMLLILFWIYVFYRKRESAKVQNVSQRHTLPVWGYILILCIINGLFFCFFSCRIIDFEEGMFRPYSFDLDYYAKLSQYLNLGYENGLLEYNFFKDIAPCPYHYFELWTNAIFYKMYGLNAVVFYMISMPMIFCTLIFIALLAILEVRKKITLQYILLAFTGLLLVDVIPYISEIFPVICGGTARLSYPKFLPMYLFLFVSVALYMYRQKQEAYYVLLSVPLLNIIPIFAVWGAVGVFLLVDTYKKRAVNRKYWMPFLIVVLLYFIYVLQSPPRTSSYRESFHWGLLRLYITQPIVYLLLYIHFTAALFLLNRKYMQAFIRGKIFLFAVTCFSALTASIMMRSYSGDASQFAMCTLPVLMYVAVVVLFLLIATETKFTRMKKKIFLFCICGISLLISFDAYKKDFIPWRPVCYDYEAKILSLLPSDRKEYRIGFYIGESGAFGNGGNYVSGVVDAVTIPDMLDYYYNNVYHFSVNKGNKEAQYADMHTPFRDYHAKRKAESPDISDDKIRISFIRENQIEYIRIFKTASLSGEFLSHLSLLAEDTVTGQRFYKVK